MAVKPYSQRACNQAVVSDCESSPSQDTETMVALMMKDDQAKIEQRKEEKNAKLQQGYIDTQISLLNDLCINEDLVASDYEKKK